MMHLKPIRCAMYSSSEVLPPALSSSAKPTKMLHSLEGNLSTIGPATRRGAWPARQVARRPAAGHPGQLERDSRAAAGTRSRKWHS